MDSSYVAPCCSSVAHAEAVAFVAGPGYEVGLGNPPVTWSESENVKWTGADAGGFGDRYFSGGVDG